MREEVPLTGGGVNHVVRIGETVRRPAGPWTPAVHALLGHLAARGFAGAPRCHGIDGDGREILDFVPGDVPHYPVPEWAWTDEALARVGALLREYHDATVDFPKNPDYAWQFPQRTPAEVICHGDAATYNCVFRDGRPVALIDFDTAHPGPRVWDLSYTAYRFVPLTDPRHVNVFPVEERARRLRVFADAYGLAAPDRNILVETARARLGHLVRYMHEQADAGNAAFAAHVADGHDRLYRTDMEYLARHRATFTSALIC
ncbi:aminoglycoside phosphotransferase family protein [Nonomuraea sp. NPDC046802]|uniref:aminoglycoside phosphotransferase family protein n=1 Tax=Nonomuraea sp. NPDC046802 TaxID=3154919 RepID=UPI0033E34FA6